MDVHLILLKFIVFIISPLKLRFSKKFRMTEEEKNLVKLSLNFPFPFCLGITE